LLYVLMWSFKRLVVNAEFLLLSLIEMTVSP